MRVHGLPWLYAVGDINGRSLLTHSGKYQARIAADHILGEQAAAEAIDLPTSGTAGASFYGHGARGTTRFVVDTEREVVVGATFVGPEVADMLQAATIAVVAEVPIPTLAHVVAPFPTRSELWLKFIEAYEIERGASAHGERRLAAA
jgi:pyruvate/2-oxoglutarate dehydrogenase complex dihydrolipoamide dehydrogenase (E3) component